MAHFERPNVYKDKHKVKRKLNQCDMSLQEDLK